MPDDEDRLRPIQAAENAGKAVVDRARGAVSWLGGHRCDACGAGCEPGREYVEEQAMVCDVWVCPECGSRFYRDAESGSGVVSFDLWDRDR